MKTDSEVTKLNKVAERILDPANGNPGQTQCQVMASEYMCELLIEVCYLPIYAENNRSSQR